MGREVVDFNHDFKTTTNTGQAIAMIDIAAFGDPAQFKQCVDALVREMRASERLPGVDRIWLPGEQSHAKRIAHARDGIPIGVALRKALDQVASEVGVAPLA